MYEFLNMLDAQMETPAPYGVFHLSAFAAVILITVLLCVKGRDVKDGAFRGICAFAWAVLIVFETYKQINFSFNYNGGEPYWDYQWYAFPFQLCSAPIYILPFVFLSREGSAVRQATVAFMGTYVLFAGLAVMFYPVSVFITTIGINIQTMVWHGTQVILGCFFLTRYRKELSARFFARGIFVFLLMVGAALALDMLIPNITDETFNMYYISPKFPSTLPILSMLYGETPVVPWWLFLVIYLVGYTIAAFLVFIAAKWLAGSKRGKKKKA